MDDLEQILKEAEAQEAARSRIRRDRKTSDRRAVSEDYARRLADKATYRRLLDESYAAQDGNRFAFYFRDREGMSLDWWRHHIDKEMNRARYRNAYRNSVRRSVSSSETRGSEPPLGETDASAGLPGLDEHLQEGK